MHDIRNRDNRRGTGAIRFVGFHLEDADGNVLEMVRTGQDVTFVFSYESSIREIDRHVVVSFAISNMYGASLILHRTNFTGQDFKIIPPIGQFKCAIPKLPLVAGRYGITGCVQIGSNIADLVEEMSYLNVVEGDFFGTGHYGWPEHSPFLIDGRWFVVPSHS
jgi:lipopolysaccharide transport system ATP-binding protein